MYTQINAQGKYSQLIWTSLGTVTQFLKEMDLKSMYLYFQQKW